MHLTGQARDATDHLTAENRIFKAKIINLSAKLELLTAKSGRLSAKRINHRTEQTFTGRFYKINGQISKNTGQTKKRIEAIDHLFGPNY